MSVDIPRTRLLDACPSVHAPREMDGRTGGSVMILHLYNLNLIPRKKERCAFRPFPRAHSLGLPYQQAMFSNPNNIAFHFSGFRPDVHPVPFV